MCREKALAMCLLDAVASAANMHSGLTEAFVHNHSGPWTSAPCLTLTGTSGAGFAPVTVFTPPPSCLPSPRCGFAFPTSRGFSPPRYYEDSDSCTAHLPCRSPRLLRHTLAAVPSPTTWTAWTSLLPPRQRLQRFSDFALHEQAHRSSPPNRVRSPTDQQFASGCSPPRLTATRLPSATELWLPPTRTFTVLMWRPHGRTHAALSVSARYTLSIRLNHFPPLTPFSSAANMRSLHTEASTHDQFRPCLSAPCVALCGTADAWLSPCFVVKLTLPPSCLPSLSTVLLSALLATFAASVP